MRDNIRVVEWVNKALIEEMSWQELPEIQHPGVKLGAELSIFYPSWANEFIIPNGADAALIRNLAKEHKP